MASIEQIKQTLGAYPEVNLSEDKGAITVVSIDEDSLSVSFYDIDGKYMVKHDNFEKEFKDKDHALKDFISTLEMFGLWPI